MLPPTLAETVHMTFGAWVSALDRCILSWSPPLVLCYTCRTALLFRNLSYTIWEAVKIFTPVYHFYYLSFPIQSVELDEDVFYTAKGG